MNDEISKDAVSDNPKDDQMNTSFCSSTNETISIGIGSSIESSDVEDQLNLDNLNNDNSSDSRSLSVQSWLSSEDNYSEKDEIKNFIQNFVHKIFRCPQQIKLADKSKFGEISQKEGARRFFSRFVSEQRVEFKEVEEETFYSLVQSFAIILFECLQNDDFSPAKILMNMSFTFYHRTLINDKNGDKNYAKEYLFECLKDQQIWTSERFWTAAFFDALQCERQNNFHSNCIIKRLEMKSFEEIQNEDQIQENLSFGQLLTFTHNMKEFGLDEKFIIKFIEKQSTIANIRDEQLDLIINNLDNLYIDNSGDN